MSWMFWKKRGKKAVSALLCMSLLGANLVPVCAEENGDEQKSEGSVKIVNIEEADDSLSAGGIEDVGDFMDAGTVEASMGLKNAGSLEGAFPGRSEELELSGESD